MKKNTNLAVAADQLLEEAREALASFNLEEAEAFRATLEAPWAEAQKKEADLIEALKDEFRKAGAHEAQFAWGTFPNVPLGLKAQWRVFRICRERDKLNREILPLLCLAAATNERIEALV